MALDVFHQVLSRLLETAGGNPKKMVSATDALKQEKLFGSAEMILNRLHSEGWITDAPAQDHVFVTVWGIEELERAKAPARAAAAPKGPEPKNAAALREAAGKARELATLLEELATGAGGGTPAQRKAKAKKAAAGVSGAVDEAFE